MGTRFVFRVLAVLGLVAVPLAARADVTNLVANPSFEVDEPILDDPGWAQWWTWGYDVGVNSTIAIDTAECIDGERSLRVEPKGVTAWYFIVAYSPLPFKVGTRYTATFWAKAKAPRSLIALMKATDNSVTWGETTFQLTTEWTECSMTSAAANATAKLEVHCAGVETPLWLDFLYVYEGEYVAGIKPSGLRNPGAAGDPSPANEATDILREVVLAWDPGPWADTHDVYLGASFDDVNTASVTDPRGVLLVRGHDANSFDAGRLEFGRTYHWRVDEVNAPPSSTVIKGEVWSFTVEPKSLPIPGSHITAAASSSGMTDVGPDKTIDGSGLNADDQHSAVATDMWLSSGTGPQPVWIQYAFDRPYVLDKLLVWNSNQSLEAIFGFGAKDVTVEYSLDGAAWTALGDFQFAQAGGEATYTANTTVPFGNVVAQQVKLTIHSNYSGSLPQKGLSEVRFYAIPVAARQPAPADGATGVSPQPTLSWRAGRLAGSHELYLSTDPEAVAQGTAPMVAVSQPAYDATLDLTTTYYWKVVEVNAVETPAAWDGQVWSFSTADFVVVDDFESYTNDSPNRVFQTWIDGAGFSPDAFFPNGHAGNSTGSLVGNDPVAGDIMEKNIVHGGSQSVPVFYDNATAAAISETTRTFAEAQDWTKFAVKTLTLHFYGNVDNSGSAPLWVKSTDGSGSSAKATFGDATALRDQAWTEWNVPLDGFAGVDLTKIASMTIGIGPGVAAGRLLLDDIRLYPTRDIPAPAAPVLVGHWKLDNNVQDSSGSGNHGTLNGDATYESPGRIGAALVLDGRDDYVDCGNAASLNVTDAITVSVWVKPKDVGNGQHNEYVIKGDTSYGLKHNYGGYMEFFIYDGDWYSANSPVLTDDFNNSWHHLLGTYDGVQTKLYIDGRLIGSRLHTGVIATSTYNLNLGRNAQYVDRLYYGSLDDARVYRGALPKSEILKLANP